MYAKGVRLILLCVMITVAPGCDNVAFGGFRVELRPPPGSGSDTLPEGDGAVAVDLGPTPLDLGPVLYIVETSGDSRASILPIAELAPEGYRSLPDDPDLVARFPLERLEGGEEFSLFLQGTQVGTFIANGTVSADSSACFTRPRIEGHVELLPEAASFRRFLALEMGDSRGIGPVEPFEPVLEDLDFRNGSVEVARRVMQANGAIGPESISGIRRSIQGISLGEGRGRALAATFVYEGTLALGEDPPAAYSVFIVAEERDERFATVLGWYQRSGSGGKAYPRLLAAHDVRGAGFPDLVVEMFGEEVRWLAIAGEGETGAGLLYQDACAEIDTPESLRVYP